MDNSNKLNETPLPEKEDLNIEGITDADYTQEKTVFKDFEIKNLGENHDLYVQSNNYC